MSKGLTKNSIAIVAAKRTAIGTFLGSLKDTPAHELGATVMGNCLKDTRLKPNDIDDVIMGQVLTAAQGQNPARQAAIKAGLPVETTAMTLNHVCGSGLRSVMLGAQAIQTGEAEVVLAGGQENMTRAPHAACLREGTKMGTMSYIDTMISDGLWDCFNDYHMGITAENIAQRYQISREAQDEFAYHSQKKTAHALKSGAFKKEICSVGIPQRKGEPICFETDEHPRLSELDKLATLRPAFTKDGTVTAGNASGINDGAACTVLMSLKEAEKRGLKPLACIRSMATAGVDPALMGIGPVPASKKALEKAGWAIKDLDLIEANEAFAAQSLAVMQELGLPLEKTNIYGGAIALGHPIGASGTRCLVTLLHAMQAEKMKKGLVTLCIGGGQGVAICLESC